MWQYNTGHSHPDKNITRGNYSFVCVCVCVCVCVRSVVRRGVSANGCLHPCTAVPGFTWCKMTVYTRMCTAVMQVAAGASLRRPAFDPGAVHVESVVNKAALRVFLRLLYFQFPVSIIHLSIHQSPRLGDRGDHDMAGARFFTCTTGWPRTAF